MDLNIYKALLSVRIRLTRWHIERLEHEINTLAREVNCKLEEESQLKRRLRMYA